MTHVVTTLRSIVRSALITALPDYVWPLDHWTKVNSAKQLPRGGVGTPRVQTNRIDVDWVERTADLVVVLKVEGDETLEAVLDNLSTSVEAVAMPVLATQSDDFDLVETQTDIDAGGHKAVGTLSMLFRVVLRTVEGNPN